MLEVEYQPEGFCREYVEIKGSSNLLVQFMAVVLGMKASCDDWFDISVAGRIPALAKAYGLVFRFDWVFAPCTTDAVDGGKKTPTTRMYGQPYSGSVKEGQVHVFFARTKESLDMSYRNGWYPLVVGKRAIHKPFIDVLRFGYFLGYPQCCVDYFRRYNNHLKYNYLYEIKRNTNGRFHPYCNPLWKDTTFSYIYHMPCSFNCKETISYVSKLREKIQQVEPGFVELCDEMQRKPLLVMREQASYAFEGVCQGDSIEYDDFAFIGVQKPGDSVLDLSSADRVEAAPGLLTLSNKGREVEEIRTENKEGFIIEFK